MSKPKRKLRRRILLVLTTFVAVLIVAVAVLLFTSSAMTVLVGVNIDEKVEHVNHNVTANETIGTDDYSTVYLTREITPEAIMEMYETLGVEATGNVAVKLSTGEAGNDYHLDANLIKDLVDEVEGTIVECNTAYPGQRTSTDIHMQVAEDHGFTAIADVDIMDTNGSISIPIEGGQYLQEDVVGANIANYDFMVVLTHFKGHPQGGFGGAMKNTSIGCASPEGKALIHTAGSSATSMFNTLFHKQDEFLDSMAEAAKAIDDYYDNGERIIYISVMNNLSVDCDCIASPAEPSMADYGILASLDPVALDQACVDIVYEAHDGHDLVERMESRNGLEILEHANEIGLGNQDYKLVSLDD